jgi:hypothetical protein
MLQNILVYIILIISVGFAIYKIFFKRKKKGAQECDSCDTGECPTDYSGCSECPLKNDCKKITDL